MNIQFRLTIEEYKDYCMSFFSQFSKEDLNKKIKQMSISEFQEWLNNISEQYNEYYDPVRELAKLIRGDYNPAIDYDSDKEDRLNNQENYTVYKKYADTHTNIFNEYLTSISDYNKKLEEIKTQRIQNEQEKLLNIEVDNVKFKAIKLIDVYWSGWECDHYAWLVNDGAEIRLVISSHGILRFADKSFLENKLLEYKKVMDDTEEMLKMMNTN